VGTFAVLSAAVNAASDGDLIRIESGLHPDAVIIDGKSLTIVGEPGARLLAFAVFGTSTLLDVCNLSP
jgi:hypothetical protein